MDSETGKPPDRDDPAEPPPWDRVGYFLQEFGAVTSAMAQRNTKLWTQVAQRLRDDAYPADQMTTDAAKAMATAMDNLEDVWTLLTRPPARERVATPLPTAFLLFTYVDGEWSLVDPVWIPTPYWDRDKLQQEAEIHLDGEGDHVDALRAALRAELKGKSYLLGVADVRDLRPGLYTGIVAIGERPLADLRIAVSA
jgi:hypothetical protein